MTWVKRRKGWRMSSAHYPNFPPLHLRHSSFSNSSVALPMLQLIPQPFRCFTYVIVHCPTLLSLLQHHGCANHATEGKRFSPPIHCCDVTKPPYLFSGELYTSPFHCKRLFVYTVCCLRGGQCFSVHRTRKSDVVGDGSGRS